jgi:hypothetical protein
MGGIGTVREGGGDGGGMREAGTSGGWWVDREL